MPSSPPTTPLDTAKAAFPTQAGDHFSVGHLGLLSALRQYAYAMPSGKGLDGRVVRGKVFLKAALGLTGVEMSWNVFPPGAAMPFWHRHQAHEEVYIFLQGRGEFVVETQTIAVSEGSVVRVAPQGARIYRNTGDTDLIFIVLQVPQNGLQAATIEDGESITKALPW